MAAYYNGQLLAPGKVAQLMQVSTKIERKTITVDDYGETGEIIGSHTEVVEEEIPIMGIVYRDTTPEENAELERQAAEMPPSEHTPEDRIAALEEQNAMLTECILELSELLYN